MPVPVLSTPKVGMSKTKLDTSIYNAAASGSKALQIGQSINASRNSATSVASSVAALANQTGGNIMGFTYE